MHAPNPIEVFAFTIEIVFQEVQHKLLIFFEALVFGNRSMVFNELSLLQSRRYLEGNDIAVPSRPDSIHSADRYVYGMTF